METVCVFAQKRVAGPCQYEPNMALLSVQAVKPAGSVSTITDFLIPTSKHGGEIFYLNHEDGPFCFHIPNITGQAGTN